MATDDPMDVPAALGLLSEALALQFRSCLHYTTAAASLGGLEYLDLAERFSSFAEAERSDAERLVAKIVALGGTPGGHVEPWSVDRDAATTVRHLIRTEREAIAALHAVIPTTGQEPQSEALEHLMEHLILRKQEQLDTLLRAVGEQE